MAHIKPHRLEDLTTIVKTANAPQQAQDDGAPWYMTSYLQSFNCSYTDWENFIGAFYVPGSVVTPFDGTLYASARLESYVQYSNLYPTMVCYCRTVADVSVAVAFAAAHPPLKVVPRSGGHCTAGWSMIQQGMCIDVSNMKGVYVEQENGVAVVQAGCTWSQVNNELEQYGLHTPGGGCDTVGVAGFALGGGFGFTSRNYGLACDNIVEVTLITGDGSVLVANATTNPAIWLACCGGMGGNFGIVTGFKIKVYNLPTVYGNLLQWYDQTVFAQVLNVYLQYYSKGPITQQMGSQAVLSHRLADPTSTTILPQLAIGFIYAGDDADGEAALATLLNGQYCPKPDQTTPYLSQKYSYVNDNLLIPIEGIIPATVVSEYKYSSYLNTLLTVPQLQRIVNWFLSSPPTGGSQYNMFGFEAYGGQIQQNAALGNAFPHREAYCDFFVDSLYQDASGFDQARSFVLDFMWDPNNKDLFSTEAYQNYPNIDYPNWPQAYFVDMGLIQALAYIKWMVDPADLFNYPQGITPIPLPPPIFPPWGFAGEPAKPLKYLAGPPHHILRGEYKKKRPQIVKPKKPHLPPPISLKDFLTANLKLTAHAHQPAVAAHAAAANGGPKTNAPRAPAAEGAKSPNIRPTKQAKTAAAAPPKKKGK